MTAVFDLAELRFDRGEVDEAMRDFDRFIDIYNTRRSRLTASEFAAVAGACRCLGRDNPQLFKDALRAYDESIAADSADLDTRVTLAELFLEKYNSSEAAGTLADVLRMNPGPAGAAKPGARATRRYEPGGSVAATPGGGATETGSATRRLLAGSSR